MGVFGEKCVRCRKKRTRRKFEGFPTCDECELKLRAPREETRYCPVDGKAMQMETLTKVIVDRCPACHGIWLDAGELDVLKKAIEKRASDAAAAAFLRRVAESI